MELYRKYRPTSLDGIRGNEASKRTLQAIIDKEERPHTFLFVGPAGCGKTTLAHIMAKELGVAEVREQNSADYRGIDSVRDMIETLAYMPLQGTQAFVMEEAHRLTPDAQEALLKPIENCPGHTYFFFTTTDAAKLNTALKTRMVVIEVAPLSYAELRDIINDVAHGEGIALSDEVALHLAKHARGSARQALTLLERVAGLSEEEQLQISGAMEAGEAVAIDLCRALVKGTTKWEEVAAVLARLETDPETVRYCILGYLRAIMLRRDSAKAFLLGQHFLKSYRETGKAGLVFSCYGAWLENAK